MTEYILMWVFVTSLSLNFLFIKKDMRRTGDGIKDYLWAVIIALVLGPVAIPGVAILARFFSDRIAREINDR